MKLFGWTTKNHGAVNPADKRISHQQCGPRLNHKKQKHSDETVLALLRRTLRGEAVTVVSNELLVPYHTAYRWNSGEQKFPLWRKVMEEIEAEQRAQKAPPKRG